MVTWLVLAAFIAINVYLTHKRVAERVENWTHRQITKRFPGLMD